MMRAQRVALSLFALCAKQGVPTALVQPIASLLHLDLCQLGHKMRRPTRILLANVDLYDT